MSDSAATVVQHISQRGNWGRQIEFVLSCIGYAVGLGNLWRFPYLCMQNGGGAFLIPYYTFLIICGMPLFFMELCIGQYSSSSPVGVYNMSPIFKGIGWGMLCVSGIMCIYYNLIMAWVMYYLGKSFAWELPWKLCNNTWNTPTCYSYYSMIQENITFAKPSMNDSWSNSSMDRPRSAAEEFWLYNTLDITEGIDNLGGFNVKLVLCLAAAWVLTFLCLIKGIKSSGKVVYVTALAPYFFLTLILIRGILLPGSWKGIEYYIMPKWEKLWTLQIWATAAMQIFYSMGPAWGGLITMASYNKFHHNVLRDSLLVPCICCLTSTYGGFAIFSVIGHMAHISNANSLEDVIQAGPGLAFVAYPEALAQLPGGSIWAVAFFLMLITVGLDSQFATFETMTSGLMDVFPNFLTKKRKTLFIFICCCVEFIFGLPFVTRGGVYLFQVIDWYSAAFSVMILGILECLIVVFIYDVRTLVSNIEEMIGNFPLFWKIWFGLCWCFLTPCSMLIVIIRSIVTFDAPVFDKTYKFPQWAITMGWIIGMLSIIPIPLMASIQIYKKRSLRKLFRPNNKWQAIVNRHREKDGNSEPDAEAMDKLNPPEYNDLSRMNYSNHSTNS